MMQEQPEPESKDNKEIRFAKASCVTVIFMMVALMFLNLVPIWFGCSIIVFFVLYTIYVIKWVK